MLYLTVKVYAVKKKLNRNQLQLMSGVTLPLLTRYWNNTTTEIKLDALERIAKALGEPPGKLIMRKDEVMKEFGMEGWRLLTEHGNEEDAA